jgi:hypothetical protein
VIPTSQTHRAGEFFITELPIRDSSLQLSSYLSNKIEVIYGKEFFPLTCEVTKFVIFRMSGTLKSHNRLSSKMITDGHWIAHYDCMLKTLRFDDKGSRVLALSGQIEESDLQGLQNVPNAEPKTADLTLDVQEVRLVYREAVRFLAPCKAKGIKLKNCPAYTRELLGIGRETGDEQC